MAFVQGRQWGTEIIWTYGPYGFSNSVDFYFFRPWLLAVIITLAVHATFFATLAGYLRAIGAGWFLWALMSVPFFLPSVQFPTVEYELAISGAVLLYLSGTTADPRSGLWLATCAGALLGLLVMVKGTGVVAAGTLIIAFGAYAVMAARAAAAGVLIGTWLTSFVVFWLLAGQSLTHIPAYFRATYEIVSGYSGAMSLLRDLPQPVRFVRMQVAFGALAVAAPAGAFLYALLRREKRLTCLLLLTTPLLFLYFKEGYVRFGDRQLVFFTLAVLIEAIVLVGSLSCCPVRVSWPVSVQSGAVGLVATMLVSGFAYDLDLVHLPPSWPERTVHGRLASYREAALLLIDAGERERLAADTRAAMRSYYGLPDSLGATDETTDILPWDIDVAYGYRLRWAPRPILQSYQAYTSYLDELDAAYLEGPRAPERLLIAERSIDGRYPPFDEPAAFRAMTSRYEAVGQVGDFVILQRHAEQLPQSLMPIKTLHAHIGDLIPVPATSEQRIYASIRVPYSLRGHALDLLFQPSALRVRFQVDHGLTNPYRLVPGTATDGVMVSDYIASEDDLRRYFEGSLDRPIRGLLVTADRPADYQGRVDVTFYATG